MGHLTYAHEFRASDVHGASGTVVGTTDTQTLTAKTLTSPTITDASLAEAIVNDGEDVYTVNGAATIRSGLHYLSKAGVLALSVAAPSNQDETRMTFISTTANAHVITFTGTTLFDGTADAKLTATCTGGFVGSSITVIAKGSAWLLESSVVMGLSA